MRVASGCWIDLSTWLVFCCYRTETCNFIRSAFHGKCSDWLQILTTQTARASSNVRVTQTQFSVLGPGWKWDKLKFKVAQNVQPLERKSPEKKVCSNTGKLCKILLWSENCHVTPWIFLAKKEFIQFYTERNIAQTCFSGQSVSRMATVLWPRLSYPRGGGATQLSQNFTKIIFRTFKKKFENLVELAQTALLRLLPTFKWPRH